MTGSQRCCRPDDCWYRCWYNMTSGAVWIRCVSRCDWNVGTERSVRGERWREGRGKNHRGFTMSEPSCERVCPLTGEEILLQSVSLLTPVCNRHKHARPAQLTLVLHFHHVASLFKRAGSDGPHWEWWKRGKKVKRKKDMSPELWGCPWLWKNLHFSVSSYSSGEHGFQEAWKLNTEFGTDL